MHLEILSLDQNSGFLTLCPLFAFNTKPVFPPLFFREKHCHLRSHTINISVTRDSKSLRKGSFSIGWMTVNILFYNLHPYFFQKKWKISTNRDSHCFRKVYNQTFTTHVKLLEYFIFVFFHFLKKEKKKLFIFNLFFSF